MLQSARPDCQQITGSASQRAHNLKAAMHMSDLCAPRVNIPVRSCIVLLCAAYACHNASPLPALTPVHDLPLQAGYQRLFPCEGTRWQSLEAAADTGLAADAADGSAQAAAVGRWAQCGVAPAGLHPARSNGTGCGVACACSGGTYAH
jgi:hypothetical protein